MLVKEGAGERAQYHVVDGWQHLATFDGDTDPSQWNARGDSTAGFDVDAYRILTRHLREARLTPLPRRSDDTWS
jgi:hypothetical protein